MQFRGDPNCDQADLNLRGRALKGRNLRGQIQGHWSDVIRAVFGLWPSGLVGFRVRARPKCWARDECLYKVEVRHTQGVDHFGIVVRVLHVLQLATSTRRRLCDRT